MKNLLQLWFGFTRPVLRRVYLTHGVALMALKYAVDASVVFQASGAWLEPWDYLSPLLGTRWSAMAGTHGLWPVGFLVVWALPFAWIGVSMSLRRSASAGFSPWWGLLFFVPGLNYVLILVLALAPDRAPEAFTRAVLGADGRRDDAEARLLFQAALQGVGVGVLVALLAGVFGLLILPHYGWSLFFGAPIAIGAASAFVFNRARTVDTWASQLVALLSILLAMGFALIFGLEGALCLAMAAPFALVGAIFGAALGRAVALAGHRSVKALWLLALAVPLLGWAEAAVAPQITQKLAPRATEPPSFAVTTAVVIDAEPGEVWESVIAFPPLPPPEWPLFRWGIAYPVGATIEGEGVGAVRRCEFSTGPFIEPITRWEPGRLLAFDVERNPDSMREWSPYGALVTRHLDSGFRAVRGEFRLEPIAGGKTRLSGTTWYRLHLAPRLYWKVWTDWIVHRIHARVLEHVGAVALGRHPAA